MQDYKVPKKKTSVLVQIPPHPAGERYVFLSPFAQNHQGAETVSDIFNFKQRFIPLFNEHGGTILAQRASISWVQVGEPRAAESMYYDTQLNAPHAAVHLELADGSSLEGQIALVGPMGGQRVADIVNREDDFIHLERGEDLLLVNLACVTSITMKE